MGSLVKKLLCSRYYSKEVFRGYEVTGICPNIAFGVSPWLQSSKSVVELHFSGMSQGWPDNQLLDAYPIL